MLCLMLFMLLLHLLFCTARFFAVSMPKTPDKYQRAWTAHDFGCQSNKYMTVASGFHGGLRLMFQRFKTCGMTFSGMYLLHARAQELP